MYQRLILLSLFTLLFSVQIFASARKANSISGKITNETGTPLRNMSVSLYSALDSSLQKIEISNTQGEFSFDLPPAGKYFIVVTGVGYKAFSSSGFEIKDVNTLSLPTFVLVTDNKKLEEVKVVGKKPLIEIQAEKTVFNVASSINAAGSNALELLKKSPGVRVDYNDNISMNGKTGVKIYIDGKMLEIDKKLAVDYLKQINSSDVEAIEIISNPSAKYEAEGNAGVINIKLKKNKKFGSNGYANFSFIQKKTDNENASLSYNYRNKKINFFSTVGGQLEKYHNTQNLLRSQNDSLFDMRSSQIYTDNNFNVKAGLDISLSNTKLLGFLATTQQSFNEFESKSNTPIYFAPSYKFARTLIASNNIPGNNNFSNFNINYKNADTTGKTLNIDVDYGFYKSIAHSYQPNYYYGNNDILLSTLIYKNNTPTDINIYSFKLGAERTAGKYQLEYGVKSSYVITQNQFDFYNVINNVDVLQKSLSNSFRFKENINAGYINARRNLSEKMQLQMGLRMEQTNSEGKLTRADGVVQTDNLVKRSYFDVFPSMALSYRMNDNNMFSLTYGRRIDRPRYQDLNPFENKLDELTYQKGNAFLKPQYTNNFEIKYIFKNSLMNTLQYSRVKDFAAEIIDQTNINATYVQMKNVATQQIISYHISLSKQLKKWWNGYFEIWYNHMFFDGQFGSSVLHLSAPDFGFYSTQSFNFGKYYSAELSGWYKAKGVWGATGITKSMGSVDAGVQRKLSKGNGTLRLNVSDIFKTQSPWRIYSDFGGVQLTGNGDFESRKITLSFTYRFGSNEVKSARQRQTSLDEENKRIKQGR